MDLSRNLKYLIIAVTLVFFVFALSFIAACQAPAQEARPAESTAAATMEEVVETTVEETIALETEAETVTADVETEETEEETMEEPMKIESPAFNNNEMIPPEYTCDGQNINPQFNISGVPGDAESLVLIVDDPDAPSKTWVHWTVWNIDPSTEEIPENSVPDGAIEGVTDFGVPGYGGPCPPSGTHRYFFKIYALDTTLDLDTSATVKDIESAMDGHILDSAELIGLYKRS